MAVTINGSGPVTGVTTLASPTTINGLTLPSDSLQPAMVLITPTSVVGGTSSGGAISFSNTASVSINGCFTSAYDIYRAELAVLSTTTFNYMGLRLRSSGTDNTAANYYGQEIYGSGTATAQYRIYGLGYWQAGLIANEDSGYYSVTFSKPFLAAPTTVSLLGGVSVPTAYAYNWSSFGRNTQSISYDGFTIIGNGVNITGIVRIYGLKN